MSDFDSFKDEYNSLDKLDLGQEVILEGYGRLFELFPSLDQKARYAYLIINKPSIAEYESTNLFMEEIDGEIKTVITDGSEYDDDYYQEEVDLDKEKVRGYLNLFEKYKDLIGPFTDIVLEPKQKVLQKKRT